MKNGEHYNFSVDKGIDRITSGSKNTHQQQQVDYLEITPMPIRKLPQEVIIEKESNLAPLDCIKNLTSQGNKQVVNDQLNKLNLFLYNNASQKTLLLILRLSLAT